MEKAERLVDLDVYKLFYPKIRKATGGYCILTLTLCFGRYAFTGVFMFEL